MRSTGEVQTPDRPGDRKGSNGPSGRLLALRAAGTSFHLEAGRPWLPDPDDPRGRAWFVTSAGRTQYRGAAGFYFRLGATETDYYARAEDVAARLAP